MRIHNALTNQTEALETVHPNEIKIYVCGPTVYDAPHIGHLRSAFVFDVIRNVLSAKLKKVTFVRNVTDVDDKILQRALEEKNTPGKVAEKYLQAYHRDLKRISVREPDIEPRATRHVEDMVRMIQKLVAGQQAYEASGNVYFRVRKFPGYGKLSHQDVDAMRENVRVEPGEGKEDALDFALWKKVTDDSPSWESPWGKGRPGWHIECSAMSTRFLGDTFDIHGGGVDLLFPHHENERAQAMAATGGDFAKVWMHHGLVTHDGRKMSKSLRNFITLDTVLKRHSTDALKLLFLQSHYASGVDFTWAKMEECEQIVKQFRIFFNQMRALGKKTKGRPHPDVERLKEGFWKALEEDFNTPQALPFLYEARHRGNAALEDAGKESALHYRGAIREQGRVLGLFPGDSERKDPHGSRVEEILRLRDALRKGRRYEASDEVRRELTELGFDIGDGQQGSECLAYPAGEREDLAGKLDAILKKAKAAR